MADALRTLELDGEISLGGRWLTLRGAHYPVYVVQVAAGACFTWCDHPAERSIEAYRDPREAIAAGLRRAARHETEGPSTHTCLKWTPSTFPDR